MLCRGLGKNWSAKVSSTKTASEREMKENLHNQSWGREVIAEGGAGDDVGKKKINEKLTGHDNRLT